jgi:hypothetical protein
MTDGNHKANEKQKIPLTALFTDDFIRRHSQYKSLAEIVKASGYEMKDILVPFFQIFCTYETNFNSWEAMCKAAPAEYLQRSRRAESTS